ncbi:hypothetical protein GCM10009800_47070 [Nocardiopsis rhodophaea]
MAIMVAGVLAVALVAVLAVVALGTGSDHGTAGGTAAQEEAADGSAPEHGKAGGNNGDGPERLQEDGSVVLAEQGANAPVVEVYADFQCPACKQFEAASGDTLRRLATDGEAIVHYRPVSIFSQQPAPLSSNSLRAGAAAPPKPVFSVRNPSGDGVPGPYGHLSLTGQVYWRRTLLPRREMSAP